MPSISGLTTGKKHNTKCIATASYNTLTVQEEDKHWVCTKPRPPQDRLSRTEQHHSKHRTKKKNRQKMNHEPRSRQHNTDKGHPKGNYPASERKPRSSARKRLDRKDNTTHSRKGALTTCLSGETCARNIADISYTASGLRAEPQLHPTMCNKEAE